MLNCNGASASAIVFSNSNSFCENQKAALLAPPFQWGLPIPNMRIMGKN
jgi:hypothetical protein